MSDFMICTDPSTYKFRDNEVYGTIYIKYKDGFFPYEHWDDLCLSMICVWGANLVSIEPGHDDLIRQWFMDGPYYLDLVYQNEQVEVQLYKNTRQGKKQLSVFSTTMTIIVGSWVKSCDTMHEYLKSIPEFTNEKMLFDMKKMMDILITKWL